MVVYAGTDVVGEGSVVHIVVGVDYVVVRGEAGDAEALHDTQVLQHQLTDHLWRERRW